MAAPKKTIRQEIESNEKFSFVRKGLEKNLMLGFLEDPLKERTLIVGTNEAYAPPAMEKELANSLLAAPELFKSILHNQLIAGALTTQEMLKKQQIELPNKTVVVVKKEGGKIVLGNVTSIVLPDIQCSNGVIHGIDTVFHPVTHEPLRAAADLGKLGTVGGASSVMPEKR